MDERMQAALELAEAFDEWSRLEARVADPDPRKLPPIEELDRVWKRVREAHERYANTR